MKLTDPNVTMREAIYLLSEGNPGAVSVLAKLASVFPATLILLDDQEIYGSDIWLAYKDISGEDLGALVENLGSHTLKEKLEAMR